MASSSHKDLPFARNDDTTTSLELFETETRPELAIQFPFELDNFQKRAVRRVHRHEHVFVVIVCLRGETIVAGHLSEKSEGTRQHNQTEQQAAHDTSTNKKQTGSPHQRR